jgi:ParB family chromosome partitioning protein
MSTGRRRGLGMGLSALLGSPEAAVLPGDGEQAELRAIPVERLRPSRFQPRRHFDEVELEALAASLRDKGVLQPLVARPLHEAGEFELVAGERRWRAAQRAGLHVLPVIVRGVSDREMLELALVENLQRQDLNALEEARAYQRLMAEFDYTQEQLGAAVGKSRPHIANTLRLLGLPEGVQELVLKGELSAGHARTLVGAENPMALAQEILQRQLSVRATEQLVAERSQRRTVRTSDGSDPDLAEIQRRLAERLGLTVAIRPRRRGGMLLIRYSSPAQLDDLLEKLFSGG